MRINKGDIEIFKRKFNFYSKNKNSNDNIAISISPFDSKSANFATRNKKVNKSISLSNIENKTSIAPNSIVKTENGYEIYFDSYQKNHSTQSNELNAQDLIAQNSNIKQAMISNNDTYNSLEDEFFNNKEEIKAEFIEDNNSSDYVRSDSNDNSRNIVINFAGNNDELQNFNKYNNISSNSNIIFKSQLYSSSIFDNNIDMSMYSKLNSKQMIKKKIFQQKPIYNLSSRLINDENDINSTLGINESYKFITTVNRKASQRKKILIINHFDINRLLSMNRQCLFVILQFMFDDIDELRSSMSSIETKVNEVLTFYYFKIVELFKEKYKNHLELYEYFFMSNNNITNSKSKTPLIYSTIKKKKKNKSSLDLYIKSKIISNDINYTYLFSLTHKTIQDKNFFSLYSWQFDLLQLCNMWVVSESEEYNGVISRFAYRSPVIEYRKGDFIVIKISLMSLNEFIDVDTVEWVEMKKEKISDKYKNDFLNYSKSVYYNSNKVMKKDYDNLRFCELEKIVHLWKSVENLHKKTIVNEIKIIFEKCFKIERFEYDIRKFYIFKVKLKARTIGIIQRNKYFQFEIEVKEKDKCVVNQTQCLGVLNWVDLEKIEIRIGECLLCYITEIYG